VITCKTSRTQPPNRFNLFGYLLEGSITEEVYRINGLLSVMTTALHMRSAERKREASLVPICLNRFLFLFPITTTGKKQRSVRHGKETIGSEQR
jgi:hypothetical protein